jgi:hypothetical protein
VTLRRILDVRRPHRVQQAHIRLAGSHVAALGEGVEEQLRRLGVPTPTPRIADPLLLAATRAEGSVWRVAREGDELSRELSEAARGAWTLSARVAARALPIVADPSALAVRPPPRLTALSLLGDVRDVDGPSVGLAFALLHLSRAAGVPIAADLAATAEITADGHLRPVDLLPQKLDAVRRWAPGIRRLLVARGQVVPADPGMEIVRVSDLGEAWARAFDEPSFDAGLARVWAADPRAAAEAASGFYRLVLREPGSALRWAAVRRGTAALRSIVDGDDRWRADVAHAVASRHAGEPLPLPAPPPGFRPRRPHRLQLLAHRVQAHNDAVEPDWQAVAAEALAAVAPPGEEHPEDLKVLGAVGRLYAAWGEWEEAVPLLSRVIDAWFDLEEPPEASYPLCELVRISGLYGDHTLLRDVAQRAARCGAHPRTSDHARTFLQLALGRAYAVRGEAGLAIAALAEEAASWAEAYGSVKSSRLRWLARVTGEPLDRLARCAADDPSGGLSYRLALADRGDESGLAALSEEDQRMFDRCRGIAPNAPRRRHLDLFPY